MTNALVLLPKGRLLEAALDFVRRAGYEARFAPRALRSAACRGVVFHLVKPRAVPTLLHLGAADAGLAGLDVARDSGLDGFTGAADTGLGRVDVVVAAADPWVVARPPPRPLVVAAEYPGLAAAWMRRRGLAHAVVETRGSTEGYVPAFADLCVDCVETGETLRANGLTALDVVMTSTMRVWRADAPRGGSRGAAREFLAAAAGAASGP